MADKQHLNEDPCLEPLIVACEEEPAFDFGSNQDQVDGMTMLEDDMCWDESQFGTEPEWATPGPQHSHGEHGHAGWMDRLFGLDADKSFIETGMEGLGYGNDGIWGRPQAPGEGDGTTMLRGLGAAACVPGVAMAAFGGHLLDEINHGPLVLHGAFDK